MALQLPNFPALAQHLAGVVNEVQNVANTLAQIHQQLVLTNTTAYPTNATTDTTADESILSRSCSIRAFG